MKRLVFEILKLYPYLAWRRNIALIHKMKRICHEEDFAVSFENRLTIKQSEKKTRLIREPYKRAEQVTKHESDGDTNASCCIWNGPQEQEETSCHSCNVTLSTIGAKLEHP